MSSSRGRLGLSVKVLPQRCLSLVCVKLTRERRAIPPRSSAAPGPLEHLSPDDLFIAVKTTGRYHRQRLELLLDTWISRNKPQVSPITDHLTPGDKVPSHCRQHLFLKGKFLFC
uniref:Fringe-like glycosyltransferase domain-containing protein n=1 Tax=Stegastes partitus TaxID=144197 RepID=A0A3B5AX48_9TELE